MRDCKACPHYPVDCSTVKWCKLEVEQLEKENAELKAQIEKMKCCENCKHYLVAARQFGYPCSMDKYYDKNCDKWESVEQ